MFFNEHQWGPEYRSVAWGYSIPLSIPLCCQSQSRRVLPLGGATKGTSMTDAISKEELVEHVTDIVAAYVSNNPVQASNLPELIETVHSALAKLADGEAAKEAEKPVPAVPVRRSVQQDYIICLEDGKKFKSMKRHLGVHYNMTPVEYRLKWGLPDDYPMVAPSYAAARSELAKSMGLGRRPKGAAKGRGKR